jgi:hypothetical protein
MELYTQNVSIYIPYAKRREKISTFTSSNPGSKYNITYQSARAELEFLVWGVK